VYTSHNATLDVSQVETREDEEQSVKLAETLELLLAAGYFRARIKGLSPFDKVLAGLFKKLFFIPQLHLHNIVKCQ